MRSEIDRVGLKIGMWLFLYSEIILFGGLFVLYAAYFHKHPASFAVGGKELNRVIGALNTVVLLLSSFTVAASITAIQKGSRKLTIGFLIFSIFCGFIFLVNKYFEWGAKIHHGIYPGSIELTGRTSGENLFYALYFLMTGLHGLHVIAGLIVLGFMAKMVATPARQSVPVSALTPDARVGATTVLVEYAEHDTLDQRKLIRLENAGLYWHLVDVIWIFLFPLYYLIS